MKKLIAQIIEVSGQYKLEGRGLEGRLVLQVKMA